MLILLIMFLTSSRAPWSSRCLPNGLYLNLNFIYLNRRALATSVDDYHQLKCIKHCSIHHRCSTPSFTFHATFCSHSGLFFATVPFSCAAPLSALLLPPAAASPPPQTKPTHVLTGRSERLFDTGGKGGSVQWRMKKCQSGVLKMNLCTRYIGWWTYEAFFFFGSALFPTLTLPLDISVFPLS